MMNKKTNNLLKFVLGLTMVAFLAACGDDDETPPIEEEEEEITNVTLTFTPMGGGTAIEATFVDPDGEDGVQQPVISALNLAANTTYSMSIELFNSIENEDVTEEIEEEDDEHQFFFNWSEGAFTSPMGNGNTDNRDDPVNYSDMDENNLPVGLMTSWTTGDAGTGSFQVILKHQPGEKSATSTVNTGSTDIDITWTLNVQ